MRRALEAADRVAFKRIAHIDTVQVHVAPKDTVSP